VWILELWGEAKQGAGILSLMAARVNSAARPGVELPVMSGQRNQSQPQEDQTSEKAHQRSTS
jgi:hypothetical protein